MNEVKSSGMSRYAGITVPEVSKDHNVFYNQILQKQCPSIVTNYDPNDTV